tara:strand:- start:263 stop:508 length:246 start_codon:yes stop_codon:yes gene_type:complete
VISTLIANIRVDKEFHTDTYLLFDMEEGNSSLSNSLCRLFYKINFGLILSMKGYEMAREMTISTQIDQINKLITQFSQADN